MRIQFIAEWCINAPEVFFISGTMNLYFMIKATYQDKKHIVTILTEAFETNKSVNHIIKNDAKRTKRIEILMAYAFDVSYANGEAFLSDDRNGCALLIYSDKKKVRLKSILWDIKLAFTCIGLFNIKRTLKRDSLIKTSHPTYPIAHLWFLGVFNRAQHKGTGSALLDDVIYHCAYINRPIYLETSTIKNIPWYQSFGFQIFKELQLGYNLYLLKKEYT